jgi:hypothetical protein
MKYFNFHQFLFNLDYFIIYCKFIDNLNFNVNFITIIIHFTIIFHIVFNIIV